MIPHARLDVREALGRMAGPLLVLVWGNALGVLLWGSGLDVALQTWLYVNYAQDFNDAMRLMGSLGKGSLQVGLCVLAGVVWALGGWRRGSVNVVAVKNILLTVPVFAAAGAVNWVLKWVIGRARPKEFLWNGIDPYQLNPFEFTAQWWSFPSGHSCSTFAIAVWLGLAFPRWRRVFWLVAAGLSFSRFLAVTPHFAGDVVAGAAVGASVAWALWIARDIARERRHG